MNIGGEVGVVSVTVREVHIVVKVVSEVEVVIVVNEIDVVNQIGVVKFTTPICQCSQLIGDVGSIISVVM